MREYYKIVDKSIFKRGLTIPKDRIDDFVFGCPVELGQSRRIDIVWGKKKYEALLCNVNRTNLGSTYQLRWDSNKDLSTKLKTEFIQSYFAIQSNYIRNQTTLDADIKRLLGGQKEVLVIKPLSVSSFSFEAFIRIETPYDNVFRQLVEANVFGWISRPEKDMMISNHTKWMPSSDLPQHEDKSFVIYYLVDQQDKTIYIGSATRLGDRVKIGRPEIPKWNLFRYEEVHPDLHKHLRQIEYHSIINFARFLKNDGNLSSLNISEYKLVNKDYGRYQK